MYHAFSEKSQEVTSTRPTAGLYSGHVRHGWRFALGFNRDEGKGNDCNVNMKTSMPDRLRLVFSIADRYLLRTDARNRGHPSCHVT